MSELEFWRVPPFSMYGPLRASRGKLRLYRSGKSKLIVTGVKAYVQEPPTGSSVQVGVNVNGRRVVGAEIEPGTVSGRGTADYAIARHSYFTADVDEVGAGDPGKHLVLSIQVGRLSYWQWLKKRIAQVFR